MIDQHTNIHLRKKVLAQLKDNLFYRPSLDRRGLLDTNRCSEYKTSKRLFTRTDNARGKEYMIHINMDTSGSMENEIYRDENGMYVTRETLTWLAIRELYALFHDFTTINLTFYGEPIAPYAGDALKRIMNKPMPKTMSDVQQEYNSIKYTIYKAGNDYCIYHHEPIQGGRERMYVATHSTDSEARDTIKALCKRQGKEYKGGDYRRVYQNKIMMENDDSTILAYTAMNVRANPDADHIILHLGDGEVDFGDLSDHMDCYINGKKAPKTGSRESALHLINLLEGKGNCQFFAVGIDTCLPVELYKKGFTVDAKNLSASLLKNLSKALSKSLSKRR